MLFSGLEILPPDPILGVAQAFAADPSPLKVDLGIGIYRDEQGRSPVLSCVKSAELSLQQNQASKAYQSSAGNPEFNLATAELIFGANHKALTDRRAFSIQTPGGTGALRVAADFLRVRDPSTIIWLPDPTWATHQPIFAACGLATRKYPYYDAASAQLLFDEMTKALSEAQPGDIIVMHGCCQNPSGADLNEGQWRQIAALIKSIGAVPFIDLAYQGFGDGLDADAGPVRMLADSLPEMLVASSNSKNFALYRDRVGALTTVAQDRKDGQIARQHILQAIRANYSMPPDHGATIVALILGDADLRAAWEQELDVMRTRIKTMRDMLSQELTSLTGVDHGFIAGQRGLFAKLGLTPAEVAYLRQVHHIYITLSGRMNIAGLSANNVRRVAEGIAAARARAAA
ncbi:MAG: amino acid aminotransferase [Pseudomonadota bacterium]